MDSVVRAVMNWMLWTVGIASIPIFFKILACFIFGKNPIDVNEELLLVSAIITGHSIGKVIVGGEAVKEPLSMYITMTISLWICLIIVITSTFLFAYISTLEKIDNSQYTIIRAISISIFIVAAVLSSSCVAHTEIHKSWAAVTGKKGYQVTVPTTEI